MGKAIALTAKAYKFRPSLAVGVEDQFMQLLFDMIAAGVAAEVEADASSSKGGIDVPALSRDSKNILAERLEKQEEIRLHGRRSET